MFGVNFIDPVTKLFGVGDVLGGITIWSIILRFCLAIICAGVVGLERARRRHAAGLRTYILVCLGSMLVMLTNQFIHASFGGTDISRLGAQVVSGIGFLGAGTILVTSRSQIKGLTTAAGLWASACIGLAIGIGFYTAAILGTVFCLVAFIFLPKLEIILTKGSNTIEIHIELYTRQDLKKVIDFIRAKGGKINLIDYNSAYANSGLSVYTINLVSWSKDNSVVIKELSEFDCVNFVEVLL